MSATVQATDDTSLAAAWLRTVNDGIRHDDDRGWLRWTAEGTGTPRWDPAPLPIIQRSAMLYLGNVAKLMSPADRIELCSLAKLRSVVDTAALLSPECTECFSLAESDSPDGLCAPCRSAEASSQQATAECTECLVDFEGTGPLCPDCTAEGVTTAERTMVECAECFEDFEGDRCPNCSAPVAATDDPSSTRVAAEPILVELVGQGLGNLREFDAKHGTELRKMLRAPALDSLVFEVPRDQAEEITQVIEHCFSFTWAPEPHVTPVNVVGKFDRGEGGELSLSVRVAEPMAAECTVCFDDIVDDAPSGLCGDCAAKELITTRQHLGDATADSKVLQQLGHYASAVGRGHGLVAGHVVVDQVTPWHTENTWPRWVWQNAAKIVELLGASA